MSNDARSPGLYKLFANGKLLTYEKGEVISVTTESDGLSYIVRGYVKRYMIANSGALAVQIVYGPQDVFPLTHLYNDLLNQSVYDGPETYYFGALSQTRVLHIDMETLRQALESNPLLYRELLSEAGRHIKASVHKIENISLGSTYHRVAHLLLYFCREFSQLTPAGICIKPPLTHQDIADIIGITRETVTRAVGNLRELGIVGEGRHLVITDPDRLQSEAYATVSRPPQKGTIPENH